MAGKIVADQIQGTTTTETVGGASVTIPNVIDTKFVVNGCTKGYEVHDNDETAVLESINISSITDGSAGICSPVFINNMATIDYSTVGGAGHESSSYRIITSTRFSAEATTSTYTYRTADSGNTGNDAKNTTTVNFGELA